jgi:methyl-accepting chemotaxis protein
MESTQKTTDELAHSVDQIAKRSLIQAKASASVSEQAAQVQNSTQETSAELEQQSGLTEKLVAYSAQLVASVGVFKLPEAS